MAFNYSIRAPILHWTLVFRLADRDVDCIVANYLLIKFWYLFSGGQLRRHRFHIGMLLQLETDAGRNRIPASGAYSLQLMLLQLRLDLSTLEYFANVLHYRNCLDGGQRLV